MRYVFLTVITLFSAYVIYYGSVLLLFKLYFVFFLIPAALFIHLVIKMIKWERRRVIREEEKRLEKEKVRLRKVHSE